MSHRYARSDDQAFESVEDSAPRPIARYVAVQLHERNEFCWAVVGEPDGAIAEDANGELFMRLTIDEAHDIAASMNALRAASHASKPVSALRDVLDGAPTTARRAIA